MKKRSITEQSIDQFNAAGISACWNLFECRNLYTDERANLLMLPHQKKKNNKLTKNRCLGAISIKTSSVGFGSNRGG